MTHVCDLGVKWKCLMKWCGSTFLTTDFMSVCFCLFSWSKSKGVDLFGYWDRFHQWRSPYSNLFEPAVSKVHLHGHPWPCMKRRKSRCAKKNLRLEIPSHMIDKSSICKLQLAIAGEHPHRAPVDGRIRSATIRYQPLPSAAPVPGRKSSHEGVALHRTLALPGLPGAQRRV